MTSVCQKNFQRLPKNVAPKHYKLKLKPDLEKFTFEGWEDITLEVVCPTHKIKMNSVDIEVQEASYTGTLNIKFTGELNDKMKGFYRSKYTLNDQEKYLAVTQFEATDARRAFPCWDEPACKATFDVTLVVPKDRIALSNMPIISDKEVEGEENLKEVSYSTTPIMSTYLLAFVVGEFDFVEGADSNGVAVKVYTPVGKSAQGEFALDVAVKTLPFYNNYFGIAYPLPKVDLIAIPDFSAGAMENWGLITYRETALLVDAENSSARIKQWVALVVGHELAHQWFGNLVTMNRGKNCENTDTHAYIRTAEFVYRALEKPVEVGHPSEVDEIFDAISYSKGSSVIRMLHDYLGDKDFRQGMNIYLTRHQYKNTCTEHLWAALEEASGKPVGDMMATWTKQKGFPVLKVEQEQNGKDRHLTVTQSKFMAGGGDPPSGYRWMVPVSVLTQAQPDNPMLLGLMDNCSKDFVLHFVAKGQWVKLNAGTVGFYRVMYPSEMLQALMPAVKDLSLPPKDRLGLQSDLFALSRAGLTPAVDVLRTVGAYKNETDFTVWSNLSSNLSSISAILQYSDCYPAFKKYVINLFSKIAAEVGWDPTPEEDTLKPLLREVVLARMGRYGDEATVAEANKRFDAHCSGEAKLPADLKSAVYATVLTNGDSVTFEKMLKLYDEADMQEERVRIGRALGSVQDKDLIQKVLFFAMSDKVRAQDAVFVISGCTGSAAGRELAWKFFKENFLTLSDRYEGGFLLSRLVQATTENFASEEMANEVEQYFKEHPLAAAERTIQQSIENIRLNAKWLEREEEAVKKFLG
ncbi:puromycin-sensitive aminopeptidase [Elysia marginata]|uniref:Aminopeptidase n=1 Tax=Elysia marginata TaxID=1093978 RepID=A0AAV4EE84_9GAST|nr:puromycin-sensitive aminopeptidase [Elysia marginata]